MGRDTDPEKTKNTEAGAVAEIVRHNQQLEVLNGLSVPVVAHPERAKRELESLERFLPSPLRPRANVQVRDHQSFVDYVERHKGPGTIVFAEITEQGGSFTAILDYHVPRTETREEGKHVDVAVITPSKAQWGEHVCKYVAEFTPEWKRWIALSGRSQKQQAMALFIEENMFDIANPAPAKMLELVKTLEATQGVEFKSAIRLDNGDRQLHYAVQTGAKAGEQGDMEIPQKFALKFAIFTNGPAYDIDCRFRYNIDGGNLLLGFEIEQPHKKIELALVDSQNAIKETLKLPVLLGSGSVTKV